MVIFPLVMPTFARYVCNLLSICFDTTELVALLRALLLVNITAGSLYAHVPTICVEVGISLLEMMLPIEDNTLLSLFVAADCACDTTLLRMLLNCAFALFAMQASAITSIALEMSCFIFLFD